MSIDLDHHVPGHLFSSPLMYSRTTTVMLSAC